jgi:hypothetical protein
MLTAACKSPHNYFVPVRRVWACQERSIDAATGISYVQGPALHKRWTITSMTSTPGLPPPAACQFWSHVVMHYFNHLPSFHD